MTASSPAPPARFCSLMLSAKIQGWPPRTIDSAVGRRRSRSVLGAEDFINPLANIFGHADQRRPFAFKTFAGQFLRRIQAELGTNGEITGRVVQHVRRSLRE